MSRLPEKPGSRLPAAIDPIQLAERGERLTGKLPIKGMQRLVELCLDDSGEVALDLQFERAETEDMYVTHGLLTSTVRVTCQRCLEPVSLDLSAKVELFFVRPDEHRDLQTQEADILAVDKPVSLSELVEDELLLVMPMIPMHDPRVCSVKQTAAMGTTQDELPPTRVSPFSVLSKLKHDKQ